MHGKNIKSKRTVEKMSKLIAISDGHELTTPGKRTPPIPELGGRVIKENEFNKAVAIMLEKELLRCGFNVINVSSTDNDSLADRVNRANAARADIFVAIHYNAFDGKFDAYDPEGLSVHIYPGSVQGRKLAENVLKYLKEGTPQKNRGIVENDFYVLRNTKMPAILTENGFMDNKREALLMIDENFQKEVAIEHAKGICDYFGAKYIEEQAEEKKSWQQAQGEKAIDALSNMDLLNSPEKWKEKDLENDNTPLWLFFEMARRIAEKNL